MSLFLAPIHYELYNKIKTAWERTGAVFIALKKETGSSLEEKSHIREDEFTSFYSNAPLEELVIGHNIHGMLEEMLNRVEMTESVILKSAVEIIGDRAVEIACNSARDFGRKKGNEVRVEDCNPGLTLQAFLSLHMETMPCNQVVGAGMTDDGGALYEHIACPHETNWKAGGSDPLLLCRIISAWMEGFVDGCSNGTCKVISTDCILKGQKTCKDLVVRS